MDKNLISPSKGKKKKAAVLCFLSNQIKHPKITHIKNIFSHFLISRNDISSTFNLHCCLKFDSTKTTTDLYINS